MLVVMKQSASAQQIDAVVSTIKEMGYGARPIPGGQRTAVGLIGNDGEVDSGRLLGLDGVLEVIPVTHPYKQVSREWREQDTVVALANGTKVGAREIVVMAGPCAVEGEAEIMDIARQLRELGATVLRGGAFKPRTSPYAFQGLGIGGLRYLAEARERTGLPVITEVMEPNQVDIVAEYADILQIGTRNMQNYSLLRDCGRVARPVMLKRGYGATIEEWLMAAEYIVSSGNPNVILCERGIRTFETYTRNTMDLTAVPLLNRLTHLPVIVDPSHATGKRWLVKPLAIGGVAVGADGVMVEVHPNPDEALSDAEQQLTLDQFRDLMAAIVPVHEHVRGLYRSTADA
jgi:3-deoxy-7-phosphoheptulonate synthase